MLSMCSAKSIIDIDFCKTCKFLLRGTNLLVLSGIKDLDPEALNAGVTNYPVYRTFTGGVTVAF